MAREFNSDMSMDSQKARETVSRLIKEIEKVVVGKNSEIIMMLSGVFAGGHILIEDVPGTGKTTLASAFSKAAGLKFRRAQFTPDIMASDITGFNIYNRAKESFEFKEGLANCNVLLADEINRASPKTQSALLEAMEEGSVTVDGVTYKLPSPFIVVATQNPSGYVGTYPLPEAQMDRFTMRLSLGYPAVAEELAIILDRKKENPLGNVETVFDAAEFNKIREMISDVEMATDIARYIVELVDATRHSELISLGASPRASLALMRTAKAYAFLMGRDYVIPEDIGAIFNSVVAHRIIPSQEARMERVTVADILEKVRRGVSVPYISQNRR